MPISKKNGIKSIQRGLTAVTTSADVTITAVNTQKTTVSVSQAGSTTGAAAYLYNATTLQLRLATGVTANVWWEVVEWY